MMRSCTRTNSSPMMWRLLLRIGDPGQRGQKLLLGVLHREVAHAPHEIGLALAHQAGVHVHAAHAVGPQRPRAQREGHAGIHAAADEEEDAARRPRTRGFPAPAAARDAAGPNPSRSRRRGTRSWPGTPCRAWCGPPRGGTAPRRSRAPGAAIAATSQVPVRPATEKPSGTRPTTSRWLIQTCCVPASPANSGSAASSSSSVARPYSPFIALADFPAEQVRHELLAVADAEHRHAQRKDRRVHRRALGVVDAARPAGDDDAPGGREFRRRRLAGADLRVHAEVAHLPGDQVAILPPRIEDDDLSCRVQVPSLASRAATVRLSKLTDVRLTQDVYQLYAEAKQAAPDTMDTLLTGLANTPEKPVATTVATNAPSGGVN